jgi:uncharacterized protein (DUF433 family)
MPLDDFYALNEPGRNLELWAAPEGRPNTAEMSEKSDWARSAPSFKPSPQRAIEWYFESTLMGYEILRNVVEINPLRRGGVPVLHGTRFTVSQTLAELARSSGVAEVAENYDLDPAAIKSMLDGLSLILMKSFTG